MIPSALDAKAHRARPAACQHHPRCPAAAAPDRTAARTVAAHPEQGWSLLCNGVILFDDSGVLLPGGHALAPACARPRPADVSAARLPSLCQVRGISPAVHTSI